MQRLINHSVGSNSMQTDIPARQEGLLAWYGTELQSDTDQWVLQLGDAEIAEIEFQGREFPVPSLYFFTSKQRNVR